jgi:transposase-like protein
MTTKKLFFIYLAHFFLEREMFQTNVVEKIKTHILCSVNRFFCKSCHLQNNVEKYCRAGEATDENMAQLLCMVDN